MALAGFGALTAGAAALGTKATRDSLYPWYVNLQKPPFQPPRQAFAPVWTVLYGLIAVSGFRLWRAKKSTQRTVALTLWGGQLAANAVCLGRTLMLSSCSDALRARLERRGYTVIATPLPAFLRSGGSACCLTLRLDHQSQEAVRTSAAAAH